MHGAVATCGLYTEGSATAMIAASVGEMVVMWVGVEGTRRIARSAGECTRAAVTGANNHDPLHGEGEQRPREMRERHQVVGMDGRWSPYAVTDSRSHVLAPGTSCGRQHVTGVCSPTPRASPCPFRRRCGHALRCGATHFHKPPVSGFPCAAMLRAWNSCTQTTVAVTTSTRAVTTVGQVRFRWRGELCICL